MVAHQSFLMRSSIPTHNNGIGVPLNIKGGDGMIVRRVVFVYVAIFNNRSFAWVAL